MHEMSLMKEVLGLVLTECESIPVRRVETISLTVGEQRDLVESFMEKYFQFLAKGTLAEGARLEVEWIPFRVQCTECLEIFPINTRKPETWYCPRCGAHQKYRVFSGHEFQVTSIDVALDDEKSDNGTAA